MYIQDHEKDTYYLPRVHTSDPGFLMVNAEEGASGPGCSTETPGAKSGSGGPKAGPVAMMTASELLKSAGADEVMTEGVAAPEWEG